MRITGLILFCAISLSFNQEQAILEVEISQVRNSHGVILLSVYSGSEEYPYKPFRTIVVNKDSLHAGKLRTTVTGLIPGTYAMGLLDDENQSGGMEYNLLGVPLEGFGFANNAKALFSRPDYGRCLFTVRPGMNRLQITVRYKR